MTDVEVKAAFINIPAGSTDGCMRMLLPGGFMGMGGSYNKNLNMFTCSFLFS